MGHASKSLKNASQALNGGNVVLFFADSEVADALQAKLSGSLFERAQPTQLVSITGLPSEKSRFWEMP